MLPIGHAGRVRFASWLDVVRSNVGDHAAFTWWNRRGDFYETDRGWRLAHALASAVVAARVSTVNVDQAARAEPGPDHAPIVITPAQ
jgi:exodeoxyribonuclease III